MFPVKMDLSIKKTVLKCVSGERDSDVLNVEIFTGKFKLIFLNRRSSNIVFVVCNVMAKLVNLLSLGK